MRTMIFSYKYKTDLKKVIIIKWLHEIQLRYETNRLPVSIQTKKHAVISY